MDSRNIVAIQRKEPEQQALYFFMKTIDSSLAMVWFLINTMATHARLAQSVEHQTFNLRVAGSSPSSGAVTFRRALFQRDGVHLNATLR